MSDVKQSICLVLGANGFVGSHLVDRLAARGDMQIRAFDRFSRRAQFHDSPQIEIVKGEIDKNKDLEYALKDVTYLMHSFSATTPFVSDENPHADIENLSRSVHIFEEAVHSGVKKIVFISSGGAVYGETAETKEVYETDTPKPVSPYGICKLSIEHYLEYFKRKFGTEYVVYRLTNPYGPRQVMKHRQGVVAAFLDNILHGKELSIFGDGSASRDFIYIEDAVSMIAETFLLPNRHRLYNIGSGKQTSLNEIVEAIKGAFQKEVPVTYQRAPKTFLQKTHVNIDRFKEEFGEPALTTFREGLEHTIQAASGGKSLYNEDDEELA